MTQLEFDFQIARVQKRFEKFNYSEDLKDLIFRYTAELPLESFIPMVERFISGTKAPVPDDFKDLATIELKRLTAEQERRDAQAKRQQQDPPQGEGLKKLLAIEGCESPWDLVEKRIRERKGSV